MDAENLARMSLAFAVDSAHKALVSRDYYQPKSSPTLVSETARFERVNC